MILEIILGSVIFILLFLLGLLNSAYRKEKKQRISLNSENIQLSFTSRKQTSVIEKLTQEFKELKNRKPEKAEKTDSYEVQELLHDLTAGKAMIAITRIAPSSFFLRSPREKQE